MVVAWKAKFFVKNLVIFGAKMCLPDVVREAYFNEALRVVGLENALLACFCSKLVPCILLA